MADYADSSELGSAQISNSKVIESFARICWAGPMKKKI